MGFRKFNIIIVFHAIAILILSSLAAHIAINTRYWLSSVWIALAIVLLIYSLVKFVGRDRKALADFLSSIKGDDFSTSYKYPGGYDEFHQIYNQFQEIFMKLRFEKESDHLYLSTIIEHISIALLCFNDKMEIILSNQAAKKLFHITLLKDFESFKKSHKELAETCISLKQGEKKLINLSIKNKLYKLSVQSTQIRIKKETIKIVSLQDIHSELNEQEVSSWKKLVRVLNHEIMNSTIPVSTLASALNKNLYDDTGNKIPLSNLPDEIAEDIYYGLSTIEKRSNGIVEFVNATRQFTYLPQPNFEETNIKDLISRIIHLLKPESTDKNIEIECSYSKSFQEIIVDPRLIEQVMINILKNAIDALYDRKNPIIRISTDLNRENEKCIRIEDNGIGMESELLEQVFIPFFTSKKNGSGIGLSISKQIMHLHKGNIDVFSKKGTGTEVVLTF